MNKISKKLFSVIAILGILGMFFPQIKVESRCIRKHSTSVRSHNRRTKNGETIRVQRHRRYYR